MCCLLHPSQNQRHEFSGSMDNVPGNVPIQVGASHWERWRAPRSRYQQQLRTWMRTLRFPGMEWNWKWIAMSNIFATLKTIECDDAASNMRDIWFHFWSNGETCSVYIKKLFKLLNMAFLDYLPNFVSTDFIENDLSTRSINMTWPYQNKLVFAFKSVDLSWFGLPHIYHNSKLPESRWFGSGATYSHWHGTEPISLLGETESSSNPWTAAHLDFATSSNIISKVIISSSKMHTPKIRTSNQPVFWIQFSAFCLAFSHLLVFPRLVFGSYSMHKHMVRNTHGTWEPFLLPFFPFNFRFEFSFEFFLRNALHKCIFHTKRTRNMPAYCVTMRILSEIQDRFNVFEPRRSDGNEQKLSLQNEVDWFRMDFMDNGSRLHGFYHLLLCVELQVIPIGHRSQVALGTRTIFIEWDFAYIE